MPSKKEKIVVKKMIAKQHQEERRKQKVGGGGSRRIIVDCDDEGFWSMEATGKECTKPSLSKASSGDVKFLRPGQVFHLPQPTGTVNNGAFVVGNGGIGVTEDFDEAVQGLSVKEYCTDVEGQVMWEGDSFAWEYSVFRMKAWAITEKLYNPVKMRSTTFEKFMLATFPKTLEMLGEEVEKKRPMIELTNEDEEGAW